MQEQYIGPKKVSVVVVDDMKTYSGADVVVVHFENSEKKLMSKKTFEMVVTEKPTDYTSVRDKKLKALYKETFPIIAEVVAVLGEDDATIQSKKTEVKQKILTLLSDIDTSDLEIERYLNDMQALLATVPQSIEYEWNNTFGRVVNFLWTKDDTQFIPGTNVLADRTFLEAKKIIDSINNDTGEQKTN